MFWGCFAAPGTGCLESVQGTMKSRLSRHSGAKRTAQCQKALSQSQVMGAPTGNDPKHTAKSTQEWVTTKDWTILKWPFMSPDLNPIEHLWKELKLAVWRRHLSNLKQLE